MSDRCDVEPLPRRLRIPALVVLAWLAGALNAGHWGGGAGLTNCTCGDAAAGGCAGCLVLTFDPFYDLARDVPLSCEVAADAAGGIRCTAHNTTRRNVGMSAGLILHCANGNTEHRWLREGLDAGERATLEPVVKAPRGNLKVPPRCDSITKVEVEERLGSWATPGCVDHVAPTVNRGCVLVGCEQCGGVKP